MTLNFLKIKYYTFPRRTYKGSTLSNIIVIVIKRDFEVFSYRLTDKKKIINEIRYIKNIFKIYHIAKFV